ncbi:MAG: hypothetical protein HQL34_10200 [Alphaproteobacteria bacterium]|nr:hypothetical protein [Alphaproteobacteria bacterium]
MTDLSQDEFDRINRALAAVLEDGVGFGDFLSDFALSNADRLEKYGLKTRFTARQWEMIRKIEARIKAMEDANDGE